MFTSTNLTLREFWRDHFNIVICLKLIEMVWQGVTRRTLTSAWRKLWPDAVAPQDFEGFEPEPERGPTPESELDEIVSIGKSMGIEVDEDSMNSSRNITTS